MDELIGWQKRMVGEHAEWEKSRAPQWWIDKQVKFVGRKLRSQLNQRYREHGSLWWCDCCVSHSVNDLFVGNNESI